MTNVITIYDAKTNLSKLVKRAQAGETVYIGAFGAPQAIIAPIPKQPKVRLGIWQGKHDITYSDADIILSDQKLNKQLTEGKLFPDEHVN